MNIKPAQPAISIVLPTYNEAENVSQLIQHIFGAFDNDCEIIVVDDNSPDGTWRIIEKIQSIYTNLFLIRRIGRRGLTSALQEGIDASRGRLIGWMDCDLSMPVDVLLELLDTVNNNADMAVGSRFMPAGGDKRHEKLHVICSALISCLCRLMLHREFHDYTSGFIVAKREVFDKIKLRGDYGEYFIDLIFNAIRADFTIKEIPYKLVSRKRGSSKTSSSPGAFVKHGFKYLKTIIRLFVSRFF